MAQTTAATAPNNPFIKQLAANDRQTRDRALSSLRTFLTRKTKFTTLDFLKLQKALFYTMWSQDKPKPQRQLALDICSLLPLLQQKENFLEFVRAFWETMRREWSGIDALRMDKFLFLCRRMVFAGFEYVKGKMWEEVLLREYLGVLMEEGPLEARDPKVPNGLRHHVVDVWVDEIERVAGGSDEDTPFEVLLMPLRRLGEKTLSKSVRERVRDALEDERVRVWIGGEEEEEDDEVLSEVEVDDDDEELGDADEDEEEEENGGEWGGFDD